MTDASGTTYYTWDARNRLTGISGPSLTASFEYDALGKRISRTANSVTTDYVYDGWDIIRDTTGGVTTDYTRTLNIDEPLAYERSNGTIRYYVQDALGSVVALTDANGAVTTSYAYDAFGNVTITGSDYNAFQYTGRENDGTGLYYYRARYYSPGMRRFISEDPIGLWGGINYYRYVGNNPTNYVDPTGRLSVGVVVGALIGGVSGAAGAIAQNGNMGEVVAGAAIGAVGGALLGLADPSEGDATTMLIAGAIGGLGNIAGQSLAKDPCANYSAGSFIGSMVGSAIGSGMGSTASNMLGQMGASSGIAALGEGMGMAPSVVGPVIGNAIDGARRR